MAGTIRDYAPADKDGVNRVALAAFAQYEGLYENWDSFRAGIGNMADLSHNADLIVAERGAIVGAVAHVGPGQPRNAFFPEHWSIIRMLVVDPAHRGAGIGKALCAAALVRSQAAGAPVIGLHTSPIMGTALSLYRAIGFQYDQALPPIRGVAYARYVLEGSAVPAALDLLRERRPGR